MRRSPWTVIGLLLLSGCSRGEAAAPSDEQDVSAHVRLETLTRRDLVENLSLYGIVVAGPESRHASSVTFDSVIRRIFVREGEAVAVGDALVEVEPTRDARLALRQARAAASTADEALTAARERLAAGLATRVELNAAEREARTATIDVRSLITRGVGRRREIRAEGPGVVKAIHGSVGDLVQASASVVDLELALHREVRLGLEVEDASRVSAGSEVMVSDLGLPARTHVRAIVRAVGEAVNSDTRLIDVYAALPESTGLLVNQRVEGMLAVHSGPVLVAPRSALVPLSDGMLVFSVDEQGVAHSHRVLAGVANATHVEISGPGLGEGARIVVAGATVLSDGMHTIEDPG